MNGTLFHFLRPYWLIALLPCALILLLWLKHQWQRGSWVNVCDADLLPYILQQKPTAQSRLPLVSAAIASVLTIFALAGPTWQRIPTPAFRNESGLVIALDLSQSMTAADVKPSRLVRARYKIADILKQRKDGQTALLVYAGDAFTVTPLTNDNATIASQLEALTPEIMPSAGSNTVSAVTKAVDLFRQAGLQNGQLLLVTDSVAGEEIDSIIKTLGSYRLSVLGVGTAEGAPIGLPEGGFLKDQAGQIVTPKLPSAELQQLASAAGGVFQVISDNDKDIKQLLAVVDKPVQDAVDKTQDNLLVAQWDEKGVYLLWLIVPLAALQFRRGLLLWAFLLLLPLPKNSYALSWQDLWRTNDQQAQQAFNNQHYSEAAAQFKQPDWKAVAYYKAKNYPQAVEALKHTKTADGYYNQGNALAQNGQLQQALTAYNQALKLNPNDKDAVYNKKLVEEALKKQQQQKDQQKQDNKHSQDQQKSKDPQQDGSKPNQPKADNSQQPADDKSQAAQDKNNQENQQDKNGKAQQQAANQQQQQDQENAQAQQAKAQQNEKNQANAQWLNRIPDDPAGLLRRKFKYQYSQQPRRAVDNGQAY
jgi:Ca-activated chloride channel family protein